MSDYDAEAVAQALWQGPVTSFNEYLAEVIEALRVAHETGARSRDAEVALLLTAWCPQRCGELAVDCDVFDCGKCGAQTCSSQASDGVICDDCWGYDDDDESEEEDGDE